MVGDRPSSDLEATARAPVAPRMRAQPGPDWGSKTRLQCVKKGNQCRKGLFPVGIVPQAIAPFFCLQFGIHTVFMPVTTERCAFSLDHSGCLDTNTDTGFLGCLQAEASCAAAVYLL